MKAWKNLRTSKKENSLKNKESKLYYTFCNRKKMNSTILNCYYKYSGLIAVIHFPSHIAAIHILSEIFIDKGNASKSLQSVTYLAVI